MNDQEARELVGRVESLLAELETMDEPGRSLAAETVQTLAELYGEGLRRVAERGVDGDLLGDELVSHLLLVHDLHPIDLEGRVRQALEEVRPYLGSHGGDVELVGVEAGVVHLRLAGSCDGCPSSAATLKLAIEDAIQRAAPDVERVEAEGVSEAPKPALVQIGSLKRNGASANGSPRDGDAWTIVGALPQLVDGGPLVKEVAGEPLAFFRIDGTDYAYRDGCPGCGESLAGSALEGAELRCAGCGDRYDARRAGRCLDAPRRSLEPVPLLVTEAGLVKVAIAAAVG